MYSLTLDVMASSGDENKDFVNYDISLTDSVIAISTGSQVKRRIWRHFDFAGSVAVFGDHEPGNAFGIGRGGLGTAEAAGVDADVRGTKSY